MKNPPRYYTTTKDATASAMQIAGVVQKYGASRFQIEWNGAGDPVGVEFLMDVPTVGRVPVLLRAQVAGLTRRLAEDAGLRSRKSHVDQARRIAWRQMLSYVEMTLELVENGVKQFHEVFMADIADESGERLVEKWERARGHLLAPGDGNMKSTTRGGAR